MENNKNQKENAKYQKQIQNKFLRRSKFSKEWGKNVKYINRIGVDTSPDQQITDSHQDILKFRQIKTSFSDKPRTWNMKPWQIICIFTQCHIPIFWHSKPAVFPWYFHGISAAFSAEYPKEIIMRFIMQEWHSCNMSQYFWERNMVEHSRPQGICTVTKATY